MKKIMFNDNYRLTQEVLDETKTMTRRIVSPSVINSYDAWYEEFLYKRVGEEPYQTLEEYITNTSKYKVGEVIAIAQSYLDAGNPQFDKFGHDVAGNTNKMFVKADLMPHHIRITDIKIERLQDISKEDCLKEGITFIESLSIIGYDAYFFTVKPKARQIYGNILKFFSSPQRAYADLIDKISGRGTWKRNPWVVAYSFKLLD
ncbi:hypothetical protein [Prevotella intermedia]|uniref:Uncharacterized protein n=1 Tax=Prevotella intermedia TaxID=28131 RepID=A0A2A6EFF9_PREIN|nr:hypothetical protein [Prevotella intermedia]PDP60154.1 hypothetical protein CLI71_06935 [Prevotella intermedia]